MGIWLIAAFLIIWIVVAAIILVSLCMVASRFDRLESKHLQEEDSNPAAVEWIVVKDPA